MMISNPFGLPKVLYLGGSRLDYFVPLMGPSLGTRLMFGIYSYGEDTYVSITSLRSVVGNMDRLSELVYESFEALAAQALPTRRKRATPQPAKRPAAARSTNKQPGAPARKRS
jgi:diacylglycerol O-acyltransferase / wax synthase